MTTMTTTATPMSIADSKSTLWLRVEDLIKIQDCEITDQKLSTKLFNWIGFFIDFNWQIQLVDLTLLYVQYTNLEILFPMNLFWWFVIW